MGKRRPVRGVAASVLAVLVLLGTAGALAGVRTAVTGEAVVQLAPPTRPPERLPDELLACRNRVQAGELVWSALSGVADRWDLVLRSTENTPGPPTVDDLRRLADVTLPDARERLERLDEVTQVYEGLEGSCGSLLDAAVGSLGEQAETCIARARAVSAVAEAGQDVEAGWRDLVALMETASTADPDAYVARWQAQAAGADAALDPFHDAVDDLGATSWCVLS